MENKLFLDTNFFIDAIHRKPEKNILESLSGFSVYVSPLSFHIYCYLFQIKTPNKELKTQKSKFRIVNLTNEILTNSFGGPTKDLEDNIQLHSAAEADCQYFLTNDKKLLDMKFFGKVKIAKEL